jgi:hypothetical protein
MFAEKSEELTKKSMNGCVNSAVVEITRLLVLFGPQLLLKKDWLPI